LTINARTVRFDTNTRNGGGATILMHDTTINASNSIEFTNNVQQASAVICLDIRNNNTFISDVIKFFNNGNTNASGAQGIFIDTNNTFQCYNMIFDRNYSTNTGSRGVRLNNASSLIKCELLNIYTTVATTMGLDASSFNQFQSRYIPSNRIPQVLAQIQTGTPYSFFSTSLMSVIPFAHLEFENIATPTTITLTTAGTFYLINLGSAIANTVLITQYSNPSAGKLKFIMPESGAQYHRIEVNISLLVSEDNEQYRFYVYKNGSATAIRSDFTGAPPNKTKYTTISLCGTL
jgi:hypothetical protein